jgi:hypothetical protein
MNVDFDLATRDIVVYLSREEATRLDCESLSLERRVGSSTFRIRADKRVGSGYISVNISKSKEEEEANFFRICNVVLNSGACSTLLEDKRCGSTYEEGARRSTIDVIINDNAAMYNFQKRPRQSR